MIDNQNGFGYSTDQLRGLRRYGRAIVGGSPHLWKSFVGRAYANSSGASGSGSSDSAPAPATKTVAEVDLVSGNVTLYEVAVEPETLEKVSLGVVVTP